MILRKSILSCFLLVWIVGEVKAQEIKRFGVPFIQNYSKSLYQSGNQNWSVAKDRKGVMYFGNSEGLLVFDGKYWKKYALPNRQIVRSVAVDKKGKVYTGAFGEFGYWEYDKVGRFNYHSISQKTLGKNILQDEIWKIYIEENKVIFQSFASIFTYEKGRITETRANSPFLFLFKVRHKYLVEVISAGISEFSEGKLFHIPGSELLKQSEVLSILPFKSHSYLLGTANDGMFIYDGHRISKWQNEGEHFLKAYQLNNGVAILDKYYAFGTILNGIIILDDQGRIVQKINKSSGLQNNTVLSLYLDDYLNLWAGLDNGIDRLQLNSPLYFFLDKTGSFGTVYCSRVFDGKIYLGTNQGLFYSHWPEKESGVFNSFNFKLIDGSQGQVWDLSLFDEQLLCGHNNGTYLVSGDRIEKTSDIKGGWTIKKLNGHPEMLIQGAYNGLALYTKDSKGKWTFLRKLEGFSEPSRYVEQDEKDQIWVSHAYKGLFALGLDDQYTKVVTSKNYDKTEGVPSSYNVHISKLGNKILLSSDSGLCMYDEVSDKFHPYSHLNKILGSYSSSNRIIKASEKKYWFINQGKVALAEFAEPGKINIDSINFNMLKGGMVQNYESISQITSSLYLISVDDGFAIFQDNAPPLHPEVVPATLIRNVESANGILKLISENGEPALPVEIPYKNNNIKFSFALPYYNRTEMMYQYFLEGYSSQWSAWSEATEKEFTNLPHGSYKFKVRGRIDGKVVSKEDSFNFTILAPWYASTLALIAYAIMAILSLILIRYLYKRNIRKHQVRIREKMDEEKEEMLRQEAIANEQKIVKLKNEQLVKDLSGKKRELANSAMNIVYKNELMQKIKVEISALKDSQGKKLSEDQLKRVQKILDEGMNDERDWNLFERSFNEAHENFFRKLKAKYPQLVPNDLKLCAYLRMNMSSKEMASLLNITLRGVEIRRYRLRKKLNLEHDKNLVEFLMEL